MDVPLRNDNGHAFDLPFGSQVGVLQFPDYENELQAGAETMKKRFFKIMYQLEQTYRFLPVVYLSLNIITALAVYGIKKPWAIALILVSALVLWVLWAKFLDKHQVVQHQEEEYTKRSPLWGEIRAQLARIEKKLDERGQ